MGKMSLNFMGFRDWAGLLPHLKMCVDPLQQRLRLRVLAEVRPENILDSQIKSVFDCS